ncbi:hypothetical protein PACTADRAFT_50195 [Pachysolen tannophilus NRRL Y-2460]|uniref:UBX domain-containing protein n=1 Tax=Pachysolen tannophilus NRRL Y-2460 TaxID=669874 RepID=A0A1E4TUT2_PACTA|nr:hypothetical protein PACTADRAFT_50195 [Pachysolen tannophilus NRRL Y-2460]
MQSDEGINDFDNLISEFVAVTGSSTGAAQKFLEENNFNLSDAIQDYYEPHEEQEKNIDQVPRPSATSFQPQNQNPGTSMTSGFGSTSASQRSIPKTNKSKPKPKFETFQQLVNGKDDDDDDEDTNFFTGGEKSALEVEDPNANDPLHAIQDLLKKAEKTGQELRNEGSSTAQPVKKFKGTGYKLGDSENPSVEIPDNSFRKPEKATRNITFWKDGFTVGDGELFRYDNPKNSSYIRELNSGRAPLALLNVKPGQDVDVNITKKLDEEYKPQKKKIHHFEGTGHRLGSPVPGDFSLSQSQESETQQATPLEQKEEQQPKKDDEGEGDAVIQFRLADGKKIVHRFNSSDPVQVVYDFVENETASSRSFFLSFAFPVKPIEDKEKSIKESGLIGSVVVQRWN